MTSPSPAAGEDEPSGLSALAGFFRWSEGIPKLLRTALEEYEDGRFFAALASLDRVVAARKPAYALDDALFVRALTLNALGWEDLAVPSLVAVIEANPPGPYYVPALLELVELHDRRSRWQPIAEAWVRYVDRPLKAENARGEEIRDLLFEFGTLRTPIAGSTRREKSLLSRPEELAVMLESRRERASDRLLYRSGLALLRLGRHQESLRALRMIAIESPYYPYARYSIAQDLFALGHVPDAVRTLTRLQRYPKITQEERGLASRSQVLRAAMLVESGEVDRAIQVARSVDDDDPEAPQARLLVTTALLAAGKPALALVYDTETVQPIVGAEARHALAVGSAYGSLGDKDSAAHVLRGAARRVHEARLSGPTLDDAVERVLGSAQAGVEERRERERMRRAHLAAGMKVALAHDGPWSFATMLRRLRAALGAGPYRELALGTKPVAAKSVATGGSWLAYLSSDRRETIETILDRLAEVEADRERIDAEASLRTLNGYLAWLERAPSDDALRKEIAQRAAAFADDLRSRGGIDVPRLRFDSDGVLAPQVAAYRRRFSEAKEVLGPSSGEPSAAKAARDEVVTLLRKWVDRELRALLEERDAELRGLEFDLDVALGGTLAGTNQATKPAAENRPK